MYFTKDNKIKLVVIQLEDPRFCCLLAPADQFKKTKAGSHELSEQIYKMMKEVEDGEIKTLDELILPAFKFEIKNYESTTVKVAEDKYMSSQSQNCVIKFGPQNVTEEMIKYNLKVDNQDESKSRGIGMPLNYTVGDESKKKIVCFNEPFVFALNDTELEDAS